MPLREELQTTGAFLFRVRSYPPLAALALVISQAGGRGYVAWRWELFCLCIAVLGIAVRAYVVGHATRGASSRETRRPVCSKLNTTGAYSIVRHPLYLGNFLVWLGVALTPSVWWLPLLVSLAFWVYYERIMFAEEEFLRKKFGLTYERWASRTPAFVPAPVLQNYVKPSLPFCLRTVVRREYSTWFGLLGTFAVVGWSRGQRLDSRWMVLACVFVVAFAALRLVKRNTPWLEVKGR